MDALSVNAGIGRTRRVIVAIGSDVAATIDGWIVTDVITGALIFSTRITVVTIGLRQAAVQLFGVIAVTRGKVANLERTRITVIRTIRILLAATGRQCMDTFLSTDITLVSRTNVTVVAWRIR